MGRIYDKISLSIQESFEYGFMDCKWCNRKSDCYHKDDLTEYYDHKKEKFSLFIVVVDNLSKETVDIRSRNFKAIDSERFVNDVVDINCQNYIKRYKCSEYGKCEIPPSGRARFLLCFQCENVSEIQYKDYNIDATVRINEFIDSNAALLETISELNDEKEKLQEEVEKWKMKFIEKENEHVNYIRNQTSLQMRVTSAEGMMCQYKIVEDDDYCRIISLEVDETVSFHREFDKSKSNHNWVNKNEALISIKGDNAFGMVLDNRTIIKSPASGIFESDNNKIIGYNEEICRIRKYDQSEREKVIEEIERKEVKEKVYEKERRKMLEREVLDELIEEGKVFNVYTKKDGNRATIPLDIANAVWNRDGGKCCICGSRENLEFDHIIPISKGGATTFRNLQILCKNCNIKKSDNI